jgi:enoyl-CoA hydratase/carnithine racemase
LLSTFPCPREASVCQAAGAHAWHEASIEAALEANTQSRATVGFREGVAAFLEKRKAEWWK